MMQNKPKSKSRPKTIPDSQLEANKIILVRGNVEYCRLVTPIDGEELKRDIRRRNSLQLTPIEKPYTSIQISNARIWPTTPDGSKSIEDQYVEERFYHRAEEADTDPWHYSLTNKSPFPNQFFMAREGTPLDCDQIFPEKELAVGLDVILMLRIYDTNFQRKGIGLRGVILQEPIRYFSANNKALEAAGIIIHSAEPPATDSIPSNTATQVSAPPQNSVYATNAQQTPPAQNAKNTWTCPQCGNEVDGALNFCGVCGNKRESGFQEMPNNNPNTNMNMNPNPNQYANQAANMTQQAPQTGGIRFDADSRNY